MSTISERGTGPWTEANGAGRSKQLRRERQSMNRRAQLVCVACGPGMIIFFAIGSIWLGHFFPPAVGESATARQVAHWYAAHTTSIRWGCLFSMVAYGLMCSWGVCVAVQTRRKEGMFPALTYGQLTAMAAGTAQIVVMTGLWAAAALRPGQIDPQITQALNDAGWLILMGTWVTFSTWAFFVGLAILLDKSSTPVFPRWSGYMSFAEGILIIAGSGCWFFKHGAFSWEGAICLYMVFAVFGFWVLYFSYASFQNVKRGFVHEQDLSPAAERDLTPAPAPTRA